MPKVLSAIDCVGPAFAQTKRQLFSPFRFQRWFRLATVCLITGEFAGGGGVPGGFNFNYPQPQSRDGGTTFFSLPPFDWANLEFYLPWIIVGAVLLLALIVLWIYIASVYRFVLFDSVLHDRCEFRGCWRRWEPCGRSYFYWSLCLIAAAMVGLPLLIGGPIYLAWRAGLFQHPGEHLAALVLGGVALLFILFACFLVSALAGLFAKDFCVPLMAMENLGVLDAWRRLLSMLAAEKMAYTGFVLMKIVLAMGSAIIFGIITLLAMLAVGIPLAIAGVLLFFLGKALGLTWSLAVIIIVGILAVVLVIGLFYLIALICTPPMVFFQSYVLHFFGSRYPTLGAVLYPPAPEPQGP